MNEAPTPGTFIRPVGTYGYCYEVVRVIPEDHEGPQQWHMKRWGMDAQRRPFDDGHHGMHYLSNLKPVAPGVWKDEWDAPTPRWSCCPLYYRQIDMGGQMALF